VYEVLESWMSTLAIARAPLVGVHGSSGNGSSGNPATITASPPARLLDGDDAVYAGAGLVQPAARPTLTPGRFRREIPLVVDAR
jgi:hypothetical protein